MVDERRQWFGGLDVCGFGASRQEEPFLAMTLDEDGVYRSLSEATNSLQDDARFLAWKSQTGVELVHLRIEIDESIADAAPLGPKVRFRGTQIDVSWRWSAATVQQRLLSASISETVHDLFEEALARASAKFPGVEWPVAPALARRGGEIVYGPDSSCLEVRVALTVEAGDWPRNLDELVDALAARLETSGAGAVDDAEEEGDEICFYLYGSDRQALVESAAPVLAAHGLLNDAYAIWEEAGKEGRVRVEF